MKLTHTALLAALTGCGLTSANAQSMPGLKFSGFGTVAAVHSSEHNADFVGTKLQPNGAGLANATSLTTETKLGGQINASITENLSAVLQVVSQFHRDNSFEPQVEWANIKYQVTRELSVRAGRIALPTFARSETRFVGYSSPWARPPIEVYSVTPITSNDGIDLSYRNKLGKANNTLQAFYGRSTIKLPPSTSTAKRNWGLTDNIEIGDFSLHATYSSVLVDVDAPGVNGVLRGIGNFRNIPGPVGARAQELLSTYRVNDLRFKNTALGANYDPGTWFLMGEFINFDGDGVLITTRSWYTTAGYRIAAWTPYLGFAKTTPKLPHETSVAGAPVGFNNLVGAVNNIVGTISGSQKTVSLGLRWDAVDNVAVKVQYDRLTTSENTPGRFINANANFRSGDSANLITFAVDFLF